MAFSSPPVAMWPGAMTCAPRPGPSTISSFVPPLWLVPILRPVPLRFLWPTARPAFAGRMTCAGCSACADLAPADPVACADATSCASLWTAPTPWSHGLRRSHHLHCMRQHRRLRRHVLCKTRGRRRPRCGLMTCADGDASWPLWTALGGMCCLRRCCRFRARARGQHAKRAVRGRREPRRAAARPGGGLPGRLAMPYDGEQLGALCRPRSACAPRRSRPSAEGRPSAGQPPIPSAAPRRGAAEAPPRRRRPRGAPPRSRRGSAASSGRRGGTPRRCGGGRRRPRRASSSRATSGRGSRRSWPLRGRRSVCARRRPLRARAHRGESAGELGRRCQRCKRSGGRSPCARALLSEACVLEREAPAACAARGWGWCCRQGAGVWALRCRAPGIASPTDGTRAAVFAGAAPRFGSADATQPSCTRFVKAVVAP